MRTTHTRPSRPHPLQGIPIALLALLVLGVACPSFGASAERPEAPMANAATAGTRSRIDAWPLLEIDEDTTTILYPLYSREGDSVTAFPFYYRTNEGRDHHVLWPLVKLSDGQLERVAPFYFAGEEQLTIFPLIHRTKQSTTLLVPPAHWRHDGDFVAVLPFYVRAGDHRFYAPSIFTQERRRRDGTKGIDRITVAPLFSYEGFFASARRKLSVLLLARSEWGDDWREIVLLPVAGVRQGTADDYVWLGPYYGDEDAQMLLPLYYGDDETRMLLPLYFEHESAREHDRWILTWRERRMEGETTSAVYPFYSDTRRQLEGGGERRELSALWPVYARDEITAKDGMQISRMRRFLMFTDDLRSDGTRRFELFGLPVGETVEERAPAPPAPAPQREA